MFKSANYRIRVEPELHRAFLDACQVQDRPAAQVIREFMKEYVTRYQDARQEDLFGAASGETQERGEDA